MKKIIKTMFVGICVAALLVGCGSDSTKKSGSDFKRNEDGGISNNALTINKYKGLEIEKIEPAAVTDEEIKAAIQTDLQAAWEKVGIKDRAAKDGDTVIIDYVGKKDGVAFAGGTANDSPLKLGSNSFIDGFEEGLVGVTPGTTVNLDLTFPENYHVAELAGQPVVFTVALDAIVPAEVTEEMVPALSTTAKNIEEYKAEVKANVEKNNAESAQEKMKESVLPTLYKECKVTELPKKELEEQIATATEYYTAEYNNYMAYVASVAGTTVEEAIKSYGMTLDTYVSSAYGATIEEIAKIQCTVNVAIKLVAVAEGMEANEETINKYIEEQAAIYGIDPADYKTQFEAQNGAEKLKEVVLQNLVIDFLWENCEIVEAKTSTDTTTTVE